jgi:O-antigen ligase
VSAPARPASAEAGRFFSTAPLLAAVLVFAPLLYGGNRPLPMLLLQLAAVALLAGTLAAGRLRHHLDLPFLVVLGVLAAVPLLQLVPLPEAAWNALPGRGFYAETLAAVGAAPARRAWSLLPAATEAAWLYLLVPIAVFLATVTSTEPVLRRLVLLFVAMAVAQALLGLAQFGTGSPLVFTPVAGGGTRSAIGTYANYNHLAGLLEMALPVALALLVAHLQRRPGSRPRQHHRSRLRRWIAQWFNGPVSFHRAALFAAAGVAILLGLVFTRSRTGVTLALVGILLSATMLARRAGVERGVGIVAMLAFVGLWLAIEVGLAPVLARFAELDPLTDTRWSIFAGTLAGAGEFFPFGAGFGTYEDVFRRFQPANVPYFVTHAHNDYVEWIFEGGLLGLLLPLAFLALYLRRWPRVWAGERWSELRFVQVAAGIALLLLGLHSATDFNLQIPANAVYFAFLAGVFFHREAAPAPRTQRAQAVRPAPPATPAASASATAPSTPAVAPTAPVSTPSAPVAEPEPVRNPFAD